MNAFLLSATMLLPGSLPALDPATQPFQGTIELPPLRLSELRAIEPDAAPGAPRVTPALRITPPVAGLQRRPRNSMPIIEPDPSINYKMLIKRPDDSIDFKMLTREVPDWSKER